MNFLNLPITLSTCMRTCAICLDISTSLAVSGFFPSVKAAILNTAPNVASSSYTKNSRSARTQFPGESMSRNPEFNVINLSDARPPHPADKKTNPTAWRDTDKILDGSCTFIS